MRKVNPEEYEAACESVMDCVDCMKEKFNWSKDVISKMLRELGESRERKRYMTRKRTPNSLQNKGICRVS